MCILKESIPTDTHAYAYTHVHQANTSADKRHVYISLSCNMRSCTSLEHSPWRVNLFPRAWRQNLGRNIVVHHTGNQETSFSPCHDKNQLFVHIFAIYHSTSKKTKSKQLPSPMTLITNKHVNGYEKPLPKSQEWNCWAWKHYRYLVLHSTSAGQSFTMLVVHMCQVQG